MRIFNSPSVSLALFLFLPIQFGLIAQAVNSTTRDHLTPKEVDLVKEAQLIDVRVDVFVRAIERRMIVLTDPAQATSKQVQKESEKWGEMPKGSQAELLGDIANILDEAITNIDDVASKEDANQTLMQKALRKLGNASSHLITQLQPLRSKIEDGPAREALEQVIDNSNTILEAAAKLPAETKSDKKKS